MELWQQIIVAIASGGMIGLTFPQHVAWLKIIADGFLSLIHMLILPLIFSSVTMGVASIRNPAKLHRVGTKTLLLYFSTTVVSVVLRLIVGYITQPAIDRHTTMSHAAYSVEPRPNKTSPISLQAIMVNLISKNPIQAFVSGNILQIIIFSALIGFALTITPQNQAQPFLKCI